MIRLNSFLHKNIRINSGWCVRDKMILLVKQALLIPISLFISRCCFCCGFCSIGKWNPDLIHKYNCAYYYVCSKNGGNAISSIERQVAFIRNMLLPLFLVIIWYDAHVKLFLFFLLLLYLIMIERQSKVYNMVFEGYEYL